MERWKLHRDLLNQLEQATEKRQILWRSLEYDLFVAESKTGERIAKIEFKSILFAGEDFPQTLIAELSIGKVQTFFVSGTEEMMRLQEILACQIPRWAEHNRSIERRLQEALSLLEALD